MPLYENVFIARQDISATQVDSLADQYAALIKEHGGEVTKKEYWGLRNLAFRIKKNRKGHYILFNIDAHGQVTNDVLAETHITLHLEDRVGGAGDRR